MANFIEVASREYQREVRESARIFWGDVADTIFVAYDLDAEALRIFSTHPEASRLEYGDEENPPQPILRNAAFAAQNRFANRVSELIAEALR